MLIGPNGPVPEPPPPPPPPPKHKAAPPVHAATPAVAVVPPMAPDAVRSGAELFISEVTKPKVSPKPTPRLPVIPPSLYLGGRRLLGPLGGSLFAAYTHATSVTRTVVAKLPKRPVKPPADPGVWSTGAGEPALQPNDLKGLLALKNMVTNDVYGPFPSERTSEPTGNLRPETAYVIQEYLEGKAGTPSESAVDRLRNLLHVLGPGDSVAMLTDMPQSAINGLGLQSALDQLVKSGQFTASDAAKIPAVQNLFVRSDAYGQSAGTNGEVTSLLDDLPQGGGSVLGAFGKSGGYVPPPGSTDAVALQTSVPKDAADAVNVYETDQRIKATDDAKALAAVAPQLARIAKTYTAQTAILDKLHNRGLVTEVLETAGEQRANADAKVLVPVNALIATNDETLQAVTTQVEGVLGKAISAHDASTYSSFNTSSGSYKLGGQTIQQWIDGWAHDQKSGPKSFTPSQLTTMVATLQGIRSAASAGTPAYTPAQIAQIKKVTAAIDRIGGPNANILIVPLAYGSSATGIQTSFLIQVKDGNSSRIVDMNGAIHQSFTAFQRDNRLTADAGHMVALQVSPQMAVTLAANGSAKTYVGQTHPGPHWWKAAASDTLHVVERGAGYAAVAGGVIAEVGGAVVEVGSDGVLTPVAAGMEVGGQALMDTGLAVNAAQAGVAFTQAALHGKFDGGAAFQFAISAAPVAGSVLGAGGKLLGVAADTDKLGANARLGAKLTLSSDAVPKLARAQRLLFVTTAAGGSAQLGYSGVQFLVHPTMSGLTNMAEGLAPMIAGHLALRGAKQLAGFGDETATSRTAPEVVPTDETDPADGAAARPPISPQSIPDERSPAKPERNVDNGLTRGSGGFAMPRMSTREMFPHDPELQNVMHILAPMRGTAQEPVMMADAPQWRFDSSDPASFRNARQTIMTYLRGAATDDTSTGDAELVVSEILSNTAKYAPGPVEVKLRWNGAHPELTVRDHGPGLVDFDADAPGDESEGRRGLPLIRALSRYAQATRPVDGGTEIRVELPMTRRASNDDLLEFGRSSAGRLKRYGQIHFGELTVRGDLEQQFIGAERDLLERNPDVARFALASLREGRPTVRIVASSDKTVYIPGAFVDRADPQLRSGKILWNPMEGGSQQTGADALLKAQVASLTTPESYRSGAWRARIADYSRAMRSSLADVRDQLRNDDRGSINFGSGRPDLTPASPGDPRPIYSVEEIPNGPARNVFDALLHGSFGSELNPYRKVVKLMAKDGSVAGAYSNLAYHEVPGPGGGVKPGGYFARTSSALTLRGAEAGDQRIMDGLDPRGFWSGVRKLIGQQTVPDDLKSRYFPGLSGVPTARNSTADAGAYADARMAEHPGLAFHFSEITAWKEVVSRKLHTLKTVLGDRLRLAMTAARERGIWFSNHNDSGEVVYQTENRLPVSGTTDRRYFGAQMRLAAEQGFYKLTRDEITEYLRTPKSDRQKFLDSRVRTDTAPLDYVVPHLGLGKFVTLNAFHLQALRDVLEDPLLAHVKFDVSWVDVVQSIVEDQKMLERVAHLMLSHPGRFVYATDATGTDNPAWYGRYDGIAKPLHDLLYLIAGAPDSPEHPLSRYFGGTVVEMNENATLRQEQYKLAMAEKVRRNDPSAPELTRRQRNRLLTWARGRTAAAVSLPQPPSVEPVEVRVPASSEAIAAGLTPGVVRVPDAILDDPSLARYYADQLNNEIGKLPVQKVRPELLTDMLNGSGAKLNSAKWHDTWSFKDPTVPNPTDRASAALRDPVLLTRDELSALANPIENRIWTSAALDAADPELTYHANRLSQLDVLNRTEVREHFAEVQRKTHADENKTEGAKYDRKKWFAGAAAAIATGGTIAALKITHLPFAADLTESAFLARAAVVLGRYAEGVRFTRINEAGVDGKMTLENAEYLRDRIVRVAGQYGQYSSGAIEDLKNAYEPLIVAFKTGALRGADAEETKKLIAEEYGRTLGIQREVLGGYGTNLEPYAGRTKIGRSLSFGTVGTYVINVASAIANPGGSLFRANPLDWYRDLFPMDNAALGLRDLRTGLSGKVPDLIRDNPRFRTFLNRVVGPTFAASGVGLFVKAGMLAHPAGWGWLVFTGGATASGRYGWLDENGTSVDPKRARAAQAAMQIGIVVAEGTQLLSSILHGSSASKTAAGVPIGRPSPRPTAPPKTTPAPPIPKPKPKPKPKPTDQQDVVTAQDGVYERAEPSVAAPVVGTLRAGTFVEVTPVSFDRLGQRFDRVAQNDGKYAWVAAAYLSAHPQGATNASGGRFDPVLKAKGYPAVTVAPGNTIWGIATSHDASLLETIALNTAHIENPDRIYPGDIIYLPKRAGTALGAVQAGDRRIT